MRFLKTMVEGLEQEVVGITSLLSNITTKPDSHKGGWARLLKCQLHNMGFKNVKILDNKDKLSDFSIIIFDLGAEYSGALNLFGGLDEKVFKRLTEISTFEGKLYSWRHQLPDVSVLESRRKNKSSCEGFVNSEPGFLGHIQNVLSRTEAFDHAYPTETLLIGDSHTPSVWTPAAMIERRDGRTLKGMLENNTLGKYFVNFLNSGIRLKHIHVHCGSIDVRHHICRELEPEMTLAGYVCQLVTKIHEYNFETVTLNHTMGIEDESRDLPKTGFYKGTPYYGDWNKRNLCRLIFNEVVSDYTRDCPGWSQVSFPEYFFDETGKLKFEVMERPQSVHLSPSHYRWDLDKNELRWK